MVDGTYKVSLKTPMGLKKGTLTLTQRDSVLTGTMDALGKQTPIADGTTDGRAFAFTGELKTPVGKLAYTCEGTVDGDAITGVAHTKKGDMPLTGTRA